MGSPIVSRFKARNPKARVQAAVIIGVTILYIILYMLSQGLNRAVMAHLAILPAILAGLSFGATAGLIVGIVAVLINIALFRFTLGNEWLATVYSSWAGDLIIMFAGYIAGILKKERAERVRVEETLHTSEDRYRAIVEEQTELICRMLPDGTITFANQSYLKFFGKTIEEVVNTNLAKWGSDEQSEMTKTSIDMLGPETPVISFDEHIQISAGDKRWIQWVYHAIIKDEQTIEIQATGRDITERKKAEKKLQEQELLLASFFYNASDAIIFMDEAQHIFSFSKSAEQIFGYSTDEIIGQSLDVLIPPRFIEVHHQHIRDFAKAPEDSRLMDNRPEICGVRKDGREFPMEASIAKLTIKDKKNFAVFLRDISDQKQAENKLRARERFLSLLNDMTHSIIVSADFNSMMKALVNDLTNLLAADHCYITRWDATKNLMIPVASSPESPFQYQEKIDLAMSVLEKDQILTMTYTPAAIATTMETEGNVSAESIIGIPLTVGKQKLGIVLVGFNQLHTFSQEEIQRAEQAGNQIAIALWNAQQDFDTRQRLRETDALARISVALSETERVGLSNVLQLIVDFAKELILGAEQAVIHLVNEEQQTLVPGAVAGMASSVPKGTKMRLDEGIAGMALSNRATINISDVETDPRFVKRNASASLRSLLVTPLQSGAKALGTISVQSSIPNAFTESDDKLLGSLGTQAAIAIENAHLIENTQQALKETNALYRVTQGVANSLDPNEVLLETVELLQKNFDYYYVQIFVVDPDTGDFVMQAGSGEIGAQLKENNYHLSPGEGIVGYTAETGTAFFTNNVEDVVSFTQNPLLPNIKSELAMPVKIGDEMLGLLDILQIPPKRLSQRDIQLIKAVADQLAIALQKANIYKELEVSLQQEKAIRNQLVQNERLAVMGRLLASVSHELNNPIQAIQNALFLLKEEKSISKQGHQDLNIVLAEAERMAAMIERLRTTYRPPQIEDFHITQINNIIQDVYALVATHLRHNEITFEFQPDIELPPVPALTDQIRQVILNLIMNAVEVMPNGGTLTVQTKFLSEQKEILLTISDTGPGIASHIQPHIFEAFITNKERGTGLGLTITYDIVTKHHGRISGENNLGRGATFKVWLPIESREII